MVSWFKEKTVERHPQNEYRNVTSLVNASKLGNEDLVSFNGMSCSELFNMFSEKWNKSNLERDEKRLISYLQCIEIANLISEKSGYSTYSRKWNLQQRCIDICDRVAQLREELDEKCYWRYIFSIKENTDSPVLITPGELIPFIQKKSKLLTVILDIRADQSNSSLSFPSHFHVTLISVPRSIIVERSAFIFNRVLLQELFKCDPFAARTLLDRINSNVFILDDKTPQMIDGRIDPKSRAGIVAAVLGDKYYGGSRMRPVLCIDGGLRKWKADYPIHVKDLTKSTENNTPSERITMTLPLLCDLSSVRSYKPNDVIEMMETPNRKISFVILDVRTAQSTSSLFFPSEADLIVVEISKKYLYLDCRSKNCSKVCHRRQEK